MSKGPLVTRTELRKRKEEAEREEQKYLEQQKKKRIKNTVKRKKKFPAFTAKNIKSKRKSQKADQMSRQKSANGAAH